MSIDECVREVAITDAGGVERAISMEATLAAPALPSVGRKGKMPAVKQSVGRKGKMPAVKQSVPFWLGLLFAALLDLRPTVIPMPDKLTLPAANSEKDADMRAENDKLYSQHVLGVGTREEVPSSASASTLNTPFEEGPTGFSVECTSMMDTGSGQSGGQAGTSGEGAAEASGEGAAEATSGSSDAGMAAAGPTQKKAKAAKAVIPCVVYSWAAGTKDPVMPEVVMAAHAEGSPMYYGWHDNADTRTKNGFSDNNPTAKAVRHAGL